MTLTSALRPPTGPVLLLSDIPPCSNYTGGVVLAQQCRLLAPGELVAFIVQNRLLQPEPYPELAWLPTEVAPKPNELYAPMNWKHGRRAAHLSERYHATVTRDRLVRQAIAFGRKHRVSAVWAILEGQTLVRMAARVARGLQVPLHSQIWDPLSWWLRAHFVDPWNAGRAEDEFRAALRASRACAAPSWAMVKQLSVEYGVRSLPLIASYDRSLARRPAVNPKHPDEVTIGMVGQFYADEAWRKFANMLHANGWEIASRRVRILYFGRTPPADVPADRLIDGGWRDTHDVIAGLSDGADICYCPYPFSSEMEETARLSFPGKAVMYMASGKPIFFHGPHYSSPAAYFMANHAAVVCSSLDPYSIHGLLRWLVKDGEVYASTAERAHQAFLQDFTTDRLRASFYEFLERAN